MNTFANRFSNTGVEAEIRRAAALADDEEPSDAMWGSEAGFGTLVNGHSFNIPAVSDVRVNHLSQGIFSWTYAHSAAYRIPQVAHR